MGKKTDLFELIKSLSKSEKRYFKLYASRHVLGDKDENSYYKIFDEISKMKEYDESLLINKFKGQSFLNRFSITKKRLYDHIINSLDQFHSEASIDARLYKMLNAASILHQKSLYNQSSKVLNSAEKLARKHHKIEILILIYSYKERWMEASGYSNVSREDIIYFLKEQSRVVEIKNTWDKLWEIKTNLFLHLHTKGIARSKEDKKQFFQITKDLAGIEVHELATPRLQYLFYHTMSTFHYAIGEFDKSLACLLKNKTLFDDNDFSISERLSLLTNGAYLSHRLQQYEQYKKFVTELRKLEHEAKITEDLQIKFFASIKSLELTLMLHEKSLDKSEEIIFQIQENLKRFSDKIRPGRVAFLYFKIAMIYMLKREYKKSLEYVNLILNDIRLDKNEDILSYSRLLRLMLFFEKGQKDLMYYEIKSTKKVLKKKNRMYAFEKLLMKYFLKLSKTRTKQDEEEVLYEIKKVLSEMENKEKMMANEIFNFEQWLTNHIKAMDMVR